MVVFKTTSEKREYSRKPVCLLEPNFESKLTVIEWEKQKNK